MKLIIIMLFTYSLSCLADWEAPEIIENACYTNCTSWMKRTYKKYLSLKSAPKDIPQMYSGECYHNSIYLNGLTTHYIGLLIDRFENQMIMVPFFQYFGKENDMKNWTLEKARKEMSGEWAKTGHFKLFPTSLTSHYDDESGYPALVYWARQDSRNDSIYLMAYMRDWSTAFCIARPNLN